MADDMDMADDDTMVATAPPQGDQNYDPFDPNYAPPSAQGDNDQEEEEEEDDEDLEIVINTATSKTGPAAGGGTYRCLALSTLLLTSLEMKTKISLDIRLIFSNLEINQDDQQREKCYN